jgi:hypothetical protein
MLYKLCKFPSTSTSLPRSSISRGILCIVPNYPSAITKDLATFRNLRVANLAAYSEAAKWTNRNADAFKDLKKEKGFVYVELGSVRFTVEEVWPEYYRNAKKT